MFSKLKELRNNLLISLRLKGLVIVVAVMILALGIVSVRNVSSINSKINETNELYLKSLIKLSGLIENIYAILIESHIVDQKSLNENTIDVSLNIDLLNTYLIEYEHSIVDEAQRSLYESFVLELQNYISIIKEVNSFQLQGKYQLASEIKATRELTSFKKLQGIIKSMISYNTKGIQTSSKIINQLEQKSINRIYLISFLVLGLSLLIVIYLIKDISGSLKDLTNNLSILRKGEIPEYELARSENELGQMAGITNELTKNLSELNRFALDISQGVYSTEYKFAGTNDMLGQALVNLRNSLRITKEEDEKRKLEEERRNWTNKGHAIFGEILRQRSREVNQLTDDIIKNLVYYLKANQGGLFLINDSSDMSKIELVSAFAYDRKKYFERSINIGDGLIGTVALERNTIYLKDVPEDYIEIESGLGDANPKCLLIVPLKFEEDILGIVEIASFKELEDFEIKFVEEVAQSIASTLLTAKINARTQQLLDESRKQSEILAAQEVEARQNMEEMRATQELAQRREADLSGIISAVDNTLMKGEYEIDGTLISVNNRHLQTMGYQLKEIKGKNIEMFIPEDELEQFRRVWANVVAGNPRQLEVRRRTKTGEDLWLINQYTPVTDITGRINKVLYFAHDITKYKKTEEELKYQIKSSKTEIEKMLEKLSFAGMNISEMDEKGKTDPELKQIFDNEFIYYELDHQGKILTTNKKFSELIGYDPDELRGKQIDEILSVNYENEEIAEQINSIKSGLLKFQDIYIKTKDGNDKWIKQYYTFTNDEEGNLLKIKVFGYDISYQKFIEKQNEKLITESRNISDALMIKDAEQKKAFHELSAEIETIKSSSSKNQLLIQALDQVLIKFETDLDFNFTKTNKNFVEKLKYTERELIGKPVSRIIEQDRKEKFINELEMVAGDKSSSIITQIISKDKGVHDVNIYILNVYNENNQKAGYIFYISGSIVIMPDTEDAIKLSEEIEIKKKELEELVIKIEQSKKLSEKSEDNSETADNESDKLYLQWLKKLKNNLD
ncbi:MAG: PAS domain S-box protein [Bacteroidales bacterium]